MENRVYCVRLWRGDVPPVHRRREQKLKRKKLKKLIREEALAVLIDAKRGPQGPQGPAGASGVMGMMTEEAVQDMIDKAFADREKEL